MASSGAPISSSFSSPLVGSETRIESAIVPRVYELIFADLGRLNGPKQRLA